MVSPLPIETCRTLLLNEIERRHGARATRPVRGRLGRKALFVRRRLDKRNSFQTWMRAELSDRDGQTVFRCRFGMHPLVRLFLTFWFATIAGLALIVIESQRFLIEMPANSDLAAFGLLAGLALLGSLITRSGRHKARGQRQFLIDFLRRSVQANQA